MQKICVFHKYKVEKSYNKEIILWNGLTTGKWVHLLKCNKCGKEKEVFADD